MLVYVGGSMRNRKGVLEVAKALEEAGVETFHSWINPGEETDDKWQEWQKSLGRDYFAAMKDPHVANVFNFDKLWLRKSDAFVMVGPAGKSAHAELGFMYGCGKPTVVLMEEEPERWDIMCPAFAWEMARTKEEVVEFIKRRLH